MKNMVVGLVLAYRNDEPHVLCGRKMNSPPAPFRGHWFLYGGKVEQGETPADAIQRELYEESGLTVVAMRHAGWLDFGGCRCHIYVIGRTAGAPRATAEMRTPRWFPVRALPQRFGAYQDRQWIKKICTDRTLFVQVRVGKYARNVRYVRGLCD